MRSLVGKWSNDNFPDNLAFPSQCAGFNSDPFTQQPRSLGKFILFPPLRLVSDLISDQNSSDSESWFIKPRGFSRDCDSR